MFAYASTKRLKVCKPYFHSYLLIYLIILIINVNHFDSRRELTVSYFFCLLFRYEQLSKEEKKMLKCYTQCKKQNGIVQLINAHRSTDYAQECKYNCSIHMWLRNIKVKICMLLACCWSKRW